MIGNCACCGTSGETQEHHIGGRAHSMITIAVCQQCHTLLTIADVYERRWNPGVSPVWRIGTGFMDLLSVLAANAGLPASMQLVTAVRDSMLPGVASLRVSSAIPEYAACDDTESCVQAISEAFDAWCANVFTALIGGYDD